MAFGTVNHIILLTNFEYYGIRGVVKDWCNSYLSNRTQTVSLGSVISEVQTAVSLGMPQGSVLGPFLSLIYINEFHNCSKVLDFHLFADDANLFFKYKDLDTLESEINRELGNVHIWLLCN